MVTVKLLQIYLCGIDDSCWMYSSALVNQIACVLPTGIAAAREKL